MTIECDYSQVCLDAFFNCKNVLAASDKKTTSFSAPVTKLLNDCAHICMGTFYAINGSVNTTQLAVLCMGICEECAEECDAMENKDFKQCAQACRYCSNSMIDLALGGLK